MAVTYYSEYKNKKLCEVVLLGSHDAGIAKGNSNTQTQTKGIGDQALKGARFFDLRIAAFANSGHGAGTVSMRAYHDDTKQSSYHKSNTRQNLGTLDADGQIANNRNQAMKVDYTVGGAKGGELYNMLAEAKAFVSAGPGAKEFLMLKFDKSTNWPLIADACIDVLGTSIYAPPGDKANLNECTLRELRGKVIVLFTKDGCGACGLTALQRRQRGILEWKNLYSSKSGSAGGYQRNFVGLQYYGKGGVSASASGQTGKIRMNAEVQTALMQGQGAYKTEKTKKTATTAAQASTRGVHAGVDANVVGLMYWTTTGMSTGGIQKRNDKMWNKPNQEMLVACTGLATEMLPSNVNVADGGAANEVKRFMPNIIMVDFVTEHQGNLVKALNTKSATEISAVINQA